jgi:hypothetical protein
MFLLNFCCSLSFYYKQQHSFLSHFSDEVKATEEKGKHQITAPKMV